jgi:hypothetical protein
VPGGSVSNDVNHDSQSARPRAAPAAPTVESQTVFKVLRSTPDCLEFLDRMRNSTWAIAGFLFMMALVLLLGTVQDAAKHGVGASQAAWFTVVLVFAGGGAAAVFFLTQKKYSFNKKSGTLVIQRQNGRGERRIIRLADITNVDVGESTDSADCWIALRLQSGKSLELASISARAPLEQFATQLRYFLGLPEPVDFLPELKRHFSNFKAALKGEIPLAAADDPADLWAQVVGHIRQKDNFGAMESMRQVIEASRAKGDEATVRKLELLLDRMRRQS